MERLNWSLGPHHYIIFFGQDRGSDYAFVPQIFDLTGTIWSNFVIAWNTLDSQDGCWLPKPRQWKGKTIERSLRNVWPKDTHLEMVILPILCWDLWPSYWSVWLTNPYKHCQTLINVTSFPFDISKDITQSLAGMILTDRSKQLGCPIVPKAYGEMKRDARYYIYDWVYISDDYVLRIYPLL